VSDIISRISSGIGHHDAISIYVLLRVNQNIQMHGAYMLWQFFVIHQNIQESPKYTSIFFSRLMYNLGEMVV
jgi:hypothetical protein